MSKKTKKIISTVVSLAMAFALVVGCFEIVGMLGGAPVTAEVLASGSDTTATTTTTAKKKKKSKKVKKAKLKVAGNTVAVDANAVAAGNVSLSKGQILTIQNSSKASFSFVKLSKANKKKFKLSKKGKLTIKKGTPAGTYTLKVKVKSKGSKKYKAGSKTAKVVLVIAPPAPPAPESTTPPAAPEDQGGGEQAPENGDEAHV